MKINVIKEKIDLDNQFGIDLQGCYDDCTEYKGKGYSNYHAIREGGFKANGKENVATVKKILELYGCYCYMQKTSKTNPYW